MTRYVIGPDVAIHLAGEEAVIPDGHHMLAPALLRSQMLSLLYQAVHRGEMTKEDAERRLFYARGMRIRLHEDHLLQNAAWQVADRLGWPDTFDAEYVAFDPARGRRFDHARSATRRCREGSGDCRTYRGAVLIEAILANDHATRWHSSA